MVIIKLSPGGPIPQKLAKTFDGPPTLERSGFEHRVGRFTSFLLRFLSPTRGTEGVVKTIEKAWLEVELPLAKGRRRDSKKTPHLFSDEEHFLEMEVDFLQPFLDIEARTALANPGEVAMA